MKAYRIVRIKEAIDLWDCFLAGLRAVEQYLPEPLDLDAFRKTLFWLIKHKDHAWVGVAFDDEERPCGFAVLEDISPLFSTRRVFYSRLFYQPAGQNQVSLTLMNAFEDWARQNNVSEYQVATARDSGSAIRCMRSAEFGFRKGYVVFKKSL